MNNIKEVDILNFPFAQQQLIEASAGTGKTWTIAALYIRLILGHKSAFQLMPENILVVTFTEAATSELKSRIQKRLLETADYFLQIDQIDNIKNEKNSVSNDIFLNDLISFYDTKEQRQNCAKLLRLASQNIDNAAIYTIHSWCKKILDEYNLYSSGLGEVKILDDETDKQQLFNIIYNYWRNYYVNIGNKNSLDFIFNNIWKNPLDLYKKIEHLLDTIQISDEFFNNKVIQENIAEKNFEKELTNCEEDINNFYNNFENSLQKLNEIFTEYQDYFNGNSLKKTEGNSFNITENLRKSFNEKDVNKIFADLTALTTKSLLEKKLKIRKGKGKGNEILESIKKVMCFDIQKLENLHIFIIKHAAYTIRKWRQQSKQLNGTLNISFDDLLIYCQNICQNNSELVKVLQQKYPVALIDEFQDTDPVQCQIFSTIYSGSNKENKTSLILIGDPKQAIYSFRGADIFAYLKAKQNIITDNHYTLKNNYRSTPEIIKTLNIFFDEKYHSNGAFLFKKNDYNPLEFVQVNAKNESKKENTNETIFPVEFCYIDEKLNKTDFIKTAAENCANKIYNLLVANNTSDVKAADCAVLVNNITEANAIQRQLKKLNIPSAYLSEKRSVFATDEAYQLFLCLQAVIDPDIKNIRLALATPLLAEKYSNIMDCNNEQTNDFFEKQITIFQQYFSYLQSQGIQATIERILLDFNCPQRFLNQQTTTINTEHSISNESGERILTNIRHLAELLQIQSKECYGEIALLNFFANCIVAAKSDKENNISEFYDNNKNNNSNVIFSPINNSEAVNQQGKDASIIRLENDSNLVKIITIHKSKGLEYKYVFLPFLCLAKDDKNDYKFPVIYYDYSNEKKYEFDKKCSWNKDDKNIKEIIKANRIKEDIRKLYVALTRAKNNLWILVGNYKNAKDSAIYTLLSDFSNGDNFWENAISNLQNLVNNNGKIILNKTEFITKQKISTSNHKNFIENTNQQFNPAEELKYKARKDFWGQTSYSALLGQGYNNNFDEFEFDIVNENDNNINNINSKNNLEEDGLLYKFKEELLQQNNYEELYYNFYNSNINNYDYLKYQNTYTFVQKYIPKGAKVGTFIHTLLEILANKNFTTTDKIFNEINLLQKLQSSGITLFKNINSVDDENYQNFISWLKIICQTPLLNLAKSKQKNKNNKNFTLPSLEQIAKNQLSIRTETEFILPVNKINTNELTDIINSMNFIKHLPDNFPRENLKIPKINGLLKGFIDLLICYENKYYVLDYKSNYVGDNFADYNATNYEKIILTHRYDVQAALYQLALHRLLKLRLANYSPEQHLGGTLFYFLRGVNDFSLSSNNSINSGIYHIASNYETIIKMDELFSK